MDQTNFRASTGGVSPYSNTGSVSKSQDIEGMTMTQGVTQPKKNWKTSVKEFFRGVEKFFKSLTQRKATVGTPKTPTSVSKTKGKGVSHAPMVGGGVGAPDFTKGTYKPMSSGNGGACLVELGSSKVVIKGGSDTGAKNEILGSMLAREVGLQAPETRFLTDKEQGEISKGMSQQGVKMPHRQDGQDPVIVMEYVHGTPIHELDKGSVSSRDMAKSFGKWMAFASFINEPDTFHGLISGRQFTAGGGINSSNFLINPKDPRGGIAGIDQNVGSGDVSDLIHDISSGKDTFFYKAADLISRTAGDHTEADEIVDSVKEGAREVYEAIGKMSPDKIREFGEQLGIAKDTINVLLERQAQIRDGV